uniref:Uncharacterized protein n=1 Tax=Glossina austeni TaxID=7395 RepID=A0A1A9V898_GLOAU
MKRQTDIKMHEGDGMLSKWKTYILTYVRQKQRSLQTVDMSSRSPDTPQNTDSCRSCKRRRDNILLLVIIPGNILLFITLWSGPKDAKQYTPGIHFEILRFNSAVSLQGREQEDT